MKLPGGYTDVNPLMSQELRFQLGEDTSSQQESPSFLGYQACNPEQGYVLQLKKGGMTLSKLSPYQDWNTFKGEAELLWSIYKEFLTDYKFSSRLLKSYLRCRCGTLAMRVKWLNSIIYTHKLTHFAPFCLASAASPTLFNSLLDSWLKKRLFTITRP